MRSGQPLKLETRSVALNVPLHLPCKMVGNPLCSLSSIIHHDCHPGPHHRVAAEAALSLGRHKPVSALFLTGHQQQAKVGFHKSPTWGIREFIGLLAEHG